MSPGRLGEVWSKGKYPALSPAQNLLGLIPKPPPRQAGQLRWEHASPAHSPPAFSQKILRLATGFGASQIGAQALNPITLWLCSGGAGTLLQS